MTVFFDLPLEMREIIYEDALQTETHFEVKPATWPAFRKEDASSIKKKDSSKPGSCMLVNLQLVCKDMTAEIKSVVARKRNLHTWKGDITIEEGIAKSNAVWTQLSCPPAFVKDITLNIAFPARFTASNANVWNLGSLGWSTDHSKRPRRLCRMLFDMLKLLIFNGPAFKVRYHLPQALNLDNLWINMSLYNEGVNHNQVFARSQMLTFVELVVHWQLAKGFIDTVHMKDYLNNSEYRYKVEDCKHSEERVLPWECEMRPFAVSERAYAVTWPDVEAGKKQ